MMWLIRILGFVTLAATLGGCWRGVYDDPAAQYFNRSDTITRGAGNAKDVNAAIHVIDPWPRDVHNRRIRGDGARMVGAVQRYQRPQVGRAAGQGAGRPGGLSSEGSVGAPPSGSGGTAGSTVSQPN